jgi:hypothetical protein
MQASRFECLSFDPFPLLQDGFVASKVDVRRRDVVDALVIALVVVVIDEAIAPRPSLLLINTVRRMCQIA